MIDLHCHLLPGIDDGPETLAESVALARAAVADGITVCAVTPHIHPGRYDNTRSKIEVYARAFRLALQKEAIALTVLLGAEVRVSVESLDLLTDNELPFLGEVRGARVMLLEWPHSHVPVGALPWVQRLLDHNIRPLIAHPERNKAIMAEPDALTPFLAAGCWLQLTAGSITGEFGRESQRVAHRLLDDDAVRIVASDAHNLTARPPVLSKARDYLTRRWGDDVAQDLLVNNPRQIVAKALAELQAGAAV